MVTGASGFLGSHYLKYTEKHHPDWKLVAQVRSTPLGFSGPSILPLTCDLTRPGSVETLASTDPDVVVHMAAAISEDNAREINARLMANVLQACQQVSAKLVYISSSQVNFETLNQYAQSKVDDEKAAAASGVPHVILRPAAPFGPPLPDHAPSRGQSMHELVKHITKLPAVPMIGDGNYTRQPVHVDDFNHAINFFIENDRFEGQAFDIGGARALTMNEIYDILAEIAGRKVIKVPIPKQVFILASNFIKQFNADLLSTIDSDERADNGPLLKVLGKDSFMPFEEAARTLF
jgi:NADH dehydrogenase